MSVDLNLDSLQDMKLADYVKAFKNKTQWKKAKHVIILQDYKLDGKKVTVALPFKKPNEAKQAFKRIKKEKLHILKKTGLGDFNLSKGDNGPMANVEFTLGGLKAETVAKKAEKLFSKIKLAVDFGLGGEAVADENTTEETTPQNEQQSMVQEEVVAQATVDENDPKAIIARLKELFQGLKTDFPQLKQVVARLKQGASAPEDQPLVAGLDSQLTEFASLLEKAPSKVQQKFAPVQEKFGSKQPQIQKILDKMGVETTETVIEEEVSSSGNPVQDAQKRIEEIKARITEIRGQLQA